MIPGRIDALAWMRSDHATPERRLLYYALWDSLRLSILGDTYERTWWRKSPAVQDYADILGFDAKSWRKSAEYWWRRADEWGKIEGSVSQWIRQRLLLDMYYAGDRDVLSLASKCMLSTVDVGVILREEGLDYDPRAGYQTAYDQSVEGCNGGGCT